MRKYLKIAALFLALLLLFILFLTRKEIPQDITYGISFNTPYAIELGLEPQAVFDAFVDELKVRNIRLSAHWPLIEPRRDLYEFDWMDHQLKRMEEVDGNVIFGVGRRLPRWPECHVPEWARDLTWEEQKEEIRDYITLVVERYKESPAITHWQVENEPYLGVFAKEQCGELDEEFLYEEIALVKSLDPSRPVLVTDSGNLGTWVGAYTGGDSFGTSVYVYFWNPELGQFRTILPPSVYRMKENLLELAYGKKETILIELSAEPWLTETLVNVPIEVQYSRMDLQKFDEILAYGKSTRYEKQFLWGGEWWYWLKEQGHADMWEKGKQLFND